MDISTLAPHKPSSPQNAALRKQAQDLEGVFLNTLTKEMFSSIKTDGAFGGGFGEETWRGMQAEQLADSIAQSGGIGLADQITRNLLDIQEAAQNPLNATPTLGANDK
jgi:flagellar protein FlgJ